MWIVVSIFNPLLAFLALAIIPVSTIGENQEALLAFLGETTGGNWLGFLVSLDAAIVLSGAVLTAYVGVGGLMERMALDRILPNILLKKNSRNSSYIIFILFFLLTVSILLVTSGNIAKLAGIYTIAFLLVMALFGIGNVLLKINRKKLPRPERASWIAVFLAIAAVLSAVVGNIILNPPYLLIFIQYLLPTLFIIYFMLYNHNILKAVLLALRRLLPENSSIFHSLNKMTKYKLAEISGKQLVFFTAGDKVENLNKVMLYIKNNEPTRHIKIVMVLEKGDDIPKNLKPDLKVLDRAYPEIKIDFVIEPGKFGPEKIKELSQRWNIPTNFMFIGAPGDEFPYEVQELGEVRLII